MNNSKEDIRKQQILDAALEVIVKSGYERSRMDDIVKSTGLSKGAIYYYYKSKKDIYLDLVNYWVHTYAESLNRISLDDLSPSEQLKELFNYFTKQYEDNPLVFRALVEFWSLSTRDTDFHRKLLKVYREFLKLISMILENGIKTKEFKALDIKTASLSIMINIEGIIWFSMYNTLGVTVQDYINTISDFILSGLTKHKNGGTA